MANEVFISEEGASQLAPGDKIVLTTEVGKKLGALKDEIAMMLFRAEERKPFPEGEVIILGMGSTRRECPFDAETWSVNWGYVQVAELEGHLEKIFMAHTQTRNQAGHDLFYWNEFNQFADAGIEVWNTHRVKGLNAKLYPLPRLIKKYKTEFFSNAICYMVVWAIELGYKKIRLYGCDMMTQEEYAWEKGGLEYWLGYAKGLGITIEVAGGSSLLKTITGKPYGVKYWKMKDIDPFGVLRRKGQRIIADTPTPTPWIKMEPL